MANFNEAPASANVKIVSPKGFDWLFTMRAENGSKLMQMMQAFESHCLENGYTPKFQGYGGPAATSNGTATNGNGYEAGSFEIESIEYAGTTSQGDHSWRVKGGKFSKYGLMMYPEAWLESGFKIPEPNSRLNVASWLAFHNGKKVTRIEKPEAQPAAEPAATPQQPATEASAWEKEAEREMEANPHKYTESVPF